MKHNILFLVKFIIAPIAITAQSCDSEVPAIPSRPNSMHEKNEDEDSYLQIGEFSSKSEQFIITDPGYDIRTATSSNMGIVVERCKVGKWIIYARQHRSSVDEFSLLAVESSIASPKAFSLRWTKVSGSVSGDSGLLGVFDRNHFGDNSIVPANQQWRLATGSPVDPSNQWYSMIAETIFEPTVQKYGIAEVPFGVVYHWDGNASVNIAQDAKGATIAIEISPN